MPVSLLNKAKRQLESLQGKTDPETLALLATLLEIINILSNLVD